MILSLLYVILSGIALPVGGIQMQYLWRNQLGDGTNSRLMRDFRIYLLVGGMPKAVDTFLNTNNLGAVDEVKREIISCYEDDLLKMDGSGRACALFGAIPLELGKRRH